MKHTNSFPVYFFFGSLREIKTTKTSIGIRQVWILCAFRPPLVYICCLFLDATSIHRELFFFYTLYFWNLIGGGERSSRNRLSRERRMIRVRHILWLASMVNELATQSWVRFCQSTEIRFAVRLWTFKRSEPTSFFFHINSTGKFMTLEWTHTHSSSRAEILTIRWKKKFPDLAHESCFLLLYLLSHLPPTAPHTQIPPKLDTSRTYTLGVFAKYKLNAHELDKFSVSQSAASWSWSGWEKHHHRRE